MRKVLFKKWTPIQYKDTGNGYEERIEGTGKFQDEFETQGFFHQWGNTYKEFESGVGNYTVALVELQDGTIAEVLPVNLKFVTQS